MTRIARIAAAVSDRANPVVVKELRQAVQSRLVIALLLLFLLANVMIVCGYLVANVDAATNERAGQVLFGILYGVLVVTCMVFVPLYTAIRLTMERNDSNIDLVFITTIAPAAIVRGKFWSAIALMALIYSACMPFMTFTYLLRGIDLPSIFSALAIAFAMNALAIMLGVFVGSIAAGWFLRLLLAGFLLFVGTWWMIYTIVAGVSVATMGVSSMFNRSEAWVIFAAAVVAGLCYWGLFYLLAVAAVSPRSSNRMFPVRVFVTAIWGGFFVLAGVWGWIENSHEPLEIWMLWFVALLSMILAFCLAEREGWTPRVRRHIPRRTLPRFVAWLFFTGSAGGVAWSFLLACLTLAAGYVATHHLGVIPLYRPKEWVETMSGVLLFSVAYSMTGLFIRRMIVPRSVPLVGTAIGLLLLALGSTLPLFLAYLIEGPNWQFERLPLPLVLSHPLVLGRVGNDREVVYSLLSAWALLAFALNLPWFLRQWKAFQRYEPRPAAAPAALVDEPAVAHA